MATQRGGHAPSPHDRISRTIAKIRESIEAICDKASALTHEKNEVEEELNLLEERRTALLLEALLPAGATPDALTELLENPRKMDKAVRGLSNGNNRRRLEQMAGDIARGRKQLEHFEARRAAFEKSQGPRLRRLYDQLNALTGERAARLKNAAADLAARLRVQILDLQDQVKDLEEQARDADATIQFKDAPRDLFKWW